ncbi:hypothetical protein OAT97_00020 [Gammaproteobacteria bacterium]|nr:hypothetical protein [Gammaproteobacteria bacterium]
MAMKQILLGIILICCCSGVLALTDAGMWAQQFILLDQQLTAAKNQITKAKEIKGEISAGLELANTMYNDTFGFIGEFTRLVEEIKSLPDWADELQESYAKHKECIKAEAKGYLNPNKLRQTVYTGRKLATDKNGDYIIDPKTGVWKVIIDPSVPKEIDTKSRITQADRMVNSCLRKVSSNKLFFMTDAELRAKTNDDLLSSADNVIYNMEKRLTATKALLDRAATLENQPAKEDHVINLLSQILVTNTSILEVISRTGKAYAMELQQEQVAENTDKLFKYQKQLKRWKKLGCDEYRNAVVEWRDKYWKPAVRTGTTDKARTQIIEFAKEKKVYSTASPFFTCVGIANLTNDKVLNKQTK